MDKVYYTNARLYGKTALLAGPFTTVEEASSCVDICTDLFQKVDVRAQAATFGVMEVNKPCGYGLYNNLLRAMGKNCPINPDAETSLPINFSS